MESNSTDFNASAFKADLTDAYCDMNDDPDDCYGRKFRKACFKAASSLGKLGMIKYMLHNDKTMSCMLVVEAMGIAASKKQTEIIDYLMGSSILKCSLNPNIRA